MINQRSADYQLTLFQKKITPFTQTPIPRTQTLNRETPGRVNADTGEGGLGCSASNLIQCLLNHDKVTEGFQQENVEHGCGQQQQDGGIESNPEDPSLLPGDLERLLEDVCDGEFEPDVQQVLEIQEQAGVGQAHQLSTQQFEAQFFM